MEERKFPQRDWKTILSYTIMEIMEIILTPLSPIFLMSIKALVGMVTEKFTSGLESPRKTKLIRTVAFLYTAKIAQRVQGC